MFLRHGIASNGSIFQPLETLISATFPGSLVDRTSYDWKDPVIINCLKFALEILNTSGDHPVYLIGHSMGGLAMLAYFFRKAFSTKAPSLVDLTTDHLFRFLQQYSVDIPNLSISASGISMFSRRSRAPFKIAMGLRMPHDGIVEDSSVDLNQSVLPNEVVNSLTAVTYISGRIPTAPMFGIRRFTGISRSNSSFWISSL